MLNHGDTFALGHGDKMLSHRLVTGNTFIESDGDGVF